MGYEDSGEEMEPRTHPPDDAVPYVAGIEYWRNKTEQYTERCDFGGIFSLESNESRRAESRQSSFTIPNSTFSSLKSLSQQFSVSPSTMLQFAWHKVLSIYGNGTHTVVATKVTDQSFRPTILDHKMFESQGSMTVIREMETEIKLTQSAKYDLNQKNLDPKTFDSLFIYGNEDSSIDPNTLQSQFRLTLVAQAVPEGSLALTVLHLGHLADDSILDDFIALLNAVMERIIANPTTALSYLEFVPLTQKLQISEWNNTNAEFPSHLRLHHLFEAAAERTPSRTAIINNELQLTYKELNDAANRFAHHLHSTVRVKPEQLIALFLDKSERTLITALGVWKSGAAYVPIDPTYPDERVKFMLEDSGAELAITNEIHSARLRTLIPLGHHTGIIQIEPLLATLKDSATPAENPKLTLTSSQLAYVTYTSGRHARIKILIAKYSKRVKPN